MANVKVSELRELSKDIDDIKVIEHKGLKIEVKTYLPIVKKTELATGIYESCVDRAGGLLTVNENSREIATVNLVTEYYTNINLPKDKIDSYDLLVQTGIYETVKQTIQDELAIIENMVNNIALKEREEYEQKNSMQYIFKGIVYELMDLIPTPEETKDMINELEKKIADFDPNKMEYVNEFMKLNRGE